MEHGDVFVRDPASLAELNNTMEYVADSLLKIEESVDSYLEGVKTVLEEQKDAIKEKLEEAEERLSEAQDDLSSCEASQEWDEEDGCYRPSCSSEQRTVESARREVEEWRRKFDDACAIVSETNHEIENYRCTGGVFTPPGGKGLIQYLAGPHTDKATEALRGCIDIISEYQETPANDGEAGEEGLIENPNKTDDDRALTDEEKQRRLEDLSGNIIRKQAENSGNIAGANRVMKCPDCGRPKALCVCGNVRKDMKMINKD
jgi:hypothetical protein